MKIGPIIALSLFYFTEINAQTSKHKIVIKNSWYILNDDVMGGVSSNVEMEDNQVVFSGKLSSEYNGGFASIRIRENFNVHERDKIVIKVLGDENTYQLRIKDNYLNDYFYVTSSNQTEEK